MQDVRGTRFEYEPQMLISCIQSGIPIHTMPIQVIYENGNAGTHFKAIQDSARVMGVLFSNFLRFISSSVASSVVDLGIAWFLIDALRPVLGEQRLFKNSACNRDCESYFHCGQLCTEQTLCIPQGG